jgi:hypothetical protein
MGEVMKSGMLESTGNEHKKDGLAGNRNMGR